MGGDSKKIDEEKCNAYASMHEEFMKGRVTIIGCPKLDDIDYSEKLTEIIAMNDIREVTIVRKDLTFYLALQFFSLAL